MKRKKKKMNTVLKVFQSDHTASPVYTLALELNTPCPNIVSMWVPSDSYERHATQHCSLPLVFKKYNFYSQA